MIMLNQIQSKLAEAIKNSGLKQAELAERLQMNQATVSHYLTGKRMPSLDTFANICGILDVDANEILCLDNFKSSTKN